jgi:hypothetical protein
MNFLEAYEEMKKGKTIWRYIQAANKKVRVFIRIYGESFIYTQKVDGLSNTFVGNIIPDDLDATNWEIVE